MTTLSKTPFLYKVPVENRANIASIYYWQGVSEIKKGIWVCDGLDLYFIHLSITATIGSQRLEKAFSFPSAFVKGMPD